MCECVHIHYTRSQGIDSLHESRKEEGRVPPPPLNLVAIILILPVRFQSVMQHTQLHTAKLAVPGPTSSTGPLLFSTATYRDDCTAKKGVLELSESPSQEASEAICSYRRLTTVLFMFVRRVWQQSPFNIKLEGSRAPWCYSIVDVALIYNMANG